MHAPLPPPPSAPTLPSHSHPHPTLITLITDHRLRCGGASNPVARSSPLPSFLPSTMALARSGKAAVGKLSPASTYFLLCDIQERFRDVIFHFPQVG